MLVSTEVPDQEVWSQVFGSTFEQYPWWRSVRFIDTTNWETPGLVHLGIDDPNEPEGSEKWIEKPVTMATLEYAINEGIKAGLVPNDVNAWDSADVADVILQLAVLGDVAYG